MRWTTAVLWESRGDRLRCDVCPMRCMLRDGEVGVCGVRRRSGDVMETATFATSVRHVDAVERKPFYHYRPGSSTLTLAAPGCTFSCGYCINHRISQYGRPAGGAWTAEPVDVADVVSAAIDARADLCLSYTEPSLALELTAALAERAAPYGINVLWKSNGFLTPAAVDLAAGLVAAVNIDLKAADTATHHRVTGAPLAPVIDTIARFIDAGVWVEVSTPLVPSISAEPEQLATIAATIGAISVDIPWHLLRFSPTFRMADEAPTPPVDLARASEIGHGVGLRYVYVERALGPGGRSTTCPGCGDPVVRRGIWKLESNNLKDGRCARCGCSIAGRWAP